MLSKVSLTIDTSERKAQTNGPGCAPSITPTEDSLFADFNLEEFLPFFSCETHKSWADKESRAEPSRAGPGQWGLKRRDSSVLSDLCLKQEVCSVICLLNYLSSLLIAVCLIKKVSLNHPIIFLISLYVVLCTCSKVKALYHNQTGRVKCSLCDHGAIFTWKEMKKQ